MSEVTEILAEMDEFLSGEYGLDATTFRRAWKLLQKNQALLSTHVVIDKETAETCTEAIRAERRRTEGVSGMEYLERSEIQLNNNLSRLQEQKK